VEGSVGAAVPGDFRQFDRVGGAVGAAAGDHWNPAPRYLDRDFDHAAMFIGRQGRSFAGRAAGNEGVAALIDLPLDELTECVFGDTATAKWRNKCRYRPEKHELFPFSRLWGRS
jgi:hypothetical protein